LKQQDTFVFDMVVIMVKAIRVMFFG